MHVPDGFVSAGVNAATAAVSLGVCAAAAARVRRTPADRRAPLFGVTAAFVFAAQMLNFPVAAGTSGHVLGATLAMILLGPAAGCLIMAVVLVVQCLGFADGGLTALGTNFFNMAIIGGLGGYAMFRLLRAVLPKTRGGFTAAAAAASWLGVTAAAAGCAVELAVSGTSPLRAALPAMVGVHALIGVGEALVTVGVLSVVLGERPDLVAAWQAQPA